MKNEKQKIKKGDWVRGIISKNITINYPFKVYFVGYGGIIVEIPESFHVRINSVLNVLSDLPYLERYAKGFHESIDDYLTHTLLSVLELICNQKHVLYNFNLDSLFSQKPRFNEKNKLG